MSLNITRRTVAAWIPAALAASSFASEWPSRPVRFIVPTAPGGPTDMVGRQIAERLAPMLRQPVVVENRAGAGHVIGMAAAAQAAPDGLTWGVVTTPLVVAPALNARLPYDTERDLLPVSLIAAQPLLLVVSPKIQVNSLAALIALARSKPRGLNMASAGKATGPHLAGELFRTMAGIEVTHVPYRGGPQATAAVLSGEADFYFDNPAAALPHVRTGKLGALAVTSKRRASALPDTPTMAEEGLPGYEFTSWTGLVAPRGTPEAIVKRMQAEVARILSSVDLQTSWSQATMEAVGSTPQDFAAMIRAELPKWRTLVKDANITAD